MASLYQVGVKKEKEPRYMKNLLTFNKNSTEKTKLNIHFWNIILS